MSDRFPRVPLLFGMLAFAAATATLSTSRATAGTLPGPASWDPSKAVVYVSLEVNPKFFIEVFDQTGTLKTPIAKITEGLNFPVGMFVDRKQNLWVANFGQKYTGYLEEYPKGSAKPIRRVAIPGKFGAPEQLYVDAKGAFYVITGFEEGNAIVKGSPDGKTWTDISDTNFGLPTGIVGDTYGNLYVSGFATVLNGAIVETLQKGQSAWQGVGFPYYGGGGGIAFDLLGRLAIADNSRSVYSYVLSLGQLQDSTHCPNCGSIAFDATGTNLWGLGATQPPSLGEYQFPGGAPEKFVQIPATGASGIAVSPAFNPPPPETAVRAETRMRRPRVSYP